LHCSETRGPRVFQKFREVSVIFHIADDHRSAEPERATARTAIIFVDAPKRAQERCRKTTLRDDDQLVPDRQLNIAIFGAMQADRVVKDSVNCRLERACRVQTLSQAS
jgi:hypothetical protein